MKKLSVKTYIVPATYCGSISKPIGKPGYKWPKRKRWLSLR